MNMFITFLFAIIFTFWTIRFYYKLYDKKIRCYILFIGFLIIFWMLIRIIKGLIDFPLGERLCWYLYYLPLIFIPTLYYVCSSSLLGKMNKNKKFIYSFSGILLLLVLTNDFHELVFKFDYDKFFYDDYTHYIGYYLICFWIFYLFSKSLVDLALYRMKYKKDMKGFLPFGVILIGLSYTICYVLNVPYIRSINMSVVNSCLICIGIELAFYLNLIPNNSKYIDKFLKSNLDMAIVSNDVKTIYTTKVFKIIPQYILDDILDSRVKESYSSDNIIYDIRKNKDSYVILKNDISEIKSIEKEIKDQRKELIKQQESIKSQEKAKKELCELKYRKEVIDKVELGLSLKRNEAKEILSKRNVSKSDLEKVQRIIIFSKKKSMLMISEINGDSYNEDAISLLINELFNSMVSSGVKGFAKIKDRIVIKGNAMSLLYDIVYELIECSLNGSIMLFISKDKDVIKLKAIIDNNLFNKDDILISSDVLIKVKNYDTDSEIEFIIKEDSK